MKFLFNQSIQKAMDLPTNSAIYGFHAGVLRLTYFGDTRADKRQLLSICPFFYESFHVGPQTLFCRLHKSSSHFDTVNIKALFLNYTPNYFISCRRIVKVNDSVSFYSAENYLVTKSVIVSTRLACLSFQNLWFA